MIILVLSTHLTSRQEEERLQAAVNLTHIDVGHTNKSIGNGGVRLWNTETLQELATPPQKRHIHGPVTCIKWVTCLYDHYETICYGTVLGYLVFWWQDHTGWFEEQYSQRIGQSKEILDIALEKPRKNEVRIAVGTQCGAVQVWKYDRNGMLTNVFAVTIGETISRKVAFTARNDSSIVVFGFEDGYVYVFLAC
jgi:hypothetical protein